ncbi:hypothetical protein KIN20_007330 [Parelaphostrongylus tenuis]|uniref:Uncharacterized protein n=1 Tax=Parelaphostrongylus tenuis TaxID=148309 RepID=A0AAD5MVD6_PARTN|nr:hypothetical protein KIN20_007330 [Parelaphostrongylus tenuis]
MFEIEEESVDPLESSEPATSIIADNINRRFPSDIDPNSFNNSLRIDIDGQHSIALPTEVQVCGRFP